MQKKTFYQTTLSCSLQPDSEIKYNRCLNGVITKTLDGFLFEEAVPKTSYKRNLKLFDGNYCSLVHMRNGKYKIHLKAIDLDSVTDRHDLAYKVYSEILTAFEVFA